MLIGLDLHGEHSVLLSVFFMADPVVGGNLVMAVWSSLFLLAAPLRIFGLPPEPQCFGPAEGGWLPDLLPVAVDTFQHRCLSLQGLSFAFGFGRGRGFLFTFSTNFLKSSKGFVLLTDISPVRTAVPGTWYSINTNQMDEWTALWHSGWQRSWNVGGLSSLGGWNQSELTSYRQSSV